MLGFKKTTFIEEFEFSSLDIDEPICMIDVDGQTETRYYYHYDGLGSVIALSNINGEVVERYRYSVFGQTQILSPNSELRTTSLYGNPYMFTGRRYDDETQLYYYRARMYSPDLGRFLQTDPIGYHDSMNLYQYCLNNPVNLIDPYGENIFGGFVSLIAGNGWDNSYDMGASEARLLGKAGLQGAGDGAEIYTGEWVRLADDLTFGKIDGLGNYVERSDRIASDYGAVGTASQWAGKISRETALLAAIPNIGEWAKNPLMYEIGQTTKAEAVLQELSAIERGKIFVEMNGGGLKGILRCLSPGATKWTQMVTGGKTLLTLPTPGGWLGVRAIWNTLGAWFNNNEKKK